MTFLGPKTIPESGKFLATHICESWAFAILSSNTVRDVGYKKGGPFILILKHHAFDRKHTESISDGHEI